VSEQIFKFLAPKVKGDPSKLKFVYLGGTELPPVLMNNVIDALVKSPPQRKSPRPQAKATSCFRSASAKWRSSRVIPTKF
jgi:hypothetical protein